MWQRAFNPRWQHSRLHEAARQKDPAQGIHLCVIVWSVMTLLTSALFQNERFSLMECIENAISAICYRAATRKIEIAYIVNPRFPEYFIGDAFRIKQILLVMSQNYLVCIWSDTSLFGRTCWWTQWNITKTKVAFSLESKFGKMTISSTASSLLCPILYHSHPLTFAKLCDKTNWSHSYIRALASIKRSGRSSFSPLFRSNATTLGRTLDQDSDYAFLESCVTSWEELYTSERVNKTLVARLCLRYEPL